MNECPRCHGEVGMDDQFCGKCGLSLQDVGALTQTADTAGMEANNPTQISTAAPTMPQSATELPLHLPPPPPSNITPVLYQDQSSANVANPYGVLPPPQSPHDNTSPTPPRKSTNRGLIVLLAFLAGVLVIGGSLFAFAASGQCHLNKKNVTEAMLCEGTALLSRSLAMERGIGAVDDARVKAQTAWRQQGRRLAQIGQQALL